MEQEAHSFPDITPRIRRHEALCEYIYGDFTDQQAEAQTRAIADAIEKRLAIKLDVEAQESGIKCNIQESENRLEIRIKDLEVKSAETKAELIHLWKTLS